MLLARAGAGHGEVVALVGEPGVGKSRLVWEVTHSQRTAGWRLLETGSVSYGKWMAYRPIIDLHRTYFQGNDRDDTQQIRDKLKEKADAGPGSGGDHTSVFGAPRRAGRGSRVGRAGSDAPPAHARRL